MTTFEVMDIAIAFASPASTGVLVGLCNYFKDIASGGKKRSFAEFFSSVLSSIIVSIGVYGALTYFESGEMFKIGVASLVALIGFDKCIEIFQKIRGSNYNEHP